MLAMLLLAGPPSGAKPGGYLLLLRGLKPIALECRVTSVPAPAERAPAPAEHELCDATALELRAANIPVTDDPKKAVAWLNVRVSSFVLPTDRQRCLGSVTLAVSALVMVIETKRYGRADLYNFDVPVNVPCSQVVADHSTALSMLLKAFVNEYVSQNR